MASIRGILTVSLTAMMLVWPIGASAQEPFFKGKTVRIVVGFAAGGGFDTYTRAIARYWGRHIPGNPSIIVENMAGAGSLIAANHVYKAARPDGLTIGNFGGGLFMQQLKGGAALSSMRANSSSWAFRFRTIAPAHSPKPAASPVWNAGWRPRHR